jgi:spore coat protein U-like protein
LLLLAPLAADAAAVCRLLSGGSLAFGSYDILASAPRDSQMTVTVSCEATGGAQTVLLTVRVDPGINGSSVANRRMLHTGGTGDALAYGIYRDPARSSVWGVSDGIDTLGATLAVPSLGAAAASFTLYGRIPPAQNARVGSYGDAVQITVSY